VHAYRPTDDTVLGLAAALWAGVLVAGLAVTRVRRTACGRCAAWALAAVVVVGADTATAGQPAGFRMVVICACLLAAMKTVVTVESRTQGEPCPAPAGWLGFAALWFGMRPVIFCRAGESPLAGAWDLVRQGLGRLAVGLALVILGRVVWLTADDWLSPPAARVAATPLLLVGLSLILHFGICNVAAGLWRWAGVACRPLFRAPLGARSLGEFWGRRWNLAFAEMTAIAVYRPLVGRFGRPAAVMGAFLFSGLLHELAISVPVRAGYGLPTLYFLLHGMLVLTEPRLELARWGGLAHVWTLGWLAAPLPVLFHPWFLEGVVWPLAGIAGA
jgi:alginate O-acetyltransferase complex protein AlgI